MQSRILTILIPLLACIVLGHSPVSACSVPVFRYALERWEPQPFDMIVFHRGPLGKTDIAAATSLAELNPPANLQFRDVDLEGPVDEASKKLWIAQEGARLPWMVVQATGQDQTPHTLWTGPLDSPDVKQLADSPLRREIRGHLLAGEAAVWVLVEGGNKQQDDAAYQLLQSQLTKLEAAIAVPEPDPNAGLDERMLTDLSLKLKFPLARLSRTDPAEKMFLRLLFFADTALLESHEPIVVPVFGRGRALVALTGKDINPERIEEVAVFLGGECSCQVKELNPGYDLLMAADWDSMMRDHSTSGELPATQPAPVPEPPIVAAASFAPKIAGAGVTPPVVEGMSHRTLLLAATGAAGTLVLLFGWLTFRRK